MHARIVERVAGLGRRRSCVEASTIAGEISATSMRSNGYAAIVPSVVPVPRPMTSARSSLGDEERREVREAALRVHLPAVVALELPVRVQRVHVAAARDGGDAAVHVLAHEARCVGRRAER